MNCPECGREGRADPDTGYNADDLCRDCAQAVEDAPVLPPPPTRDRRVVVQWPTGEWQIIGWTDRQPADIMGSVIAHNLIACRRSYYLYRPLASPSETMKHFHANQQ